MKLPLWFVSALLASAPTMAAADSVITYHNGNQRHGAYTVPDLTFAAAAKMHRDTGFNGRVSGHVYAQPLYWNPKGASRGLVVVATESNKVYALDENSGASVWQRTLGRAVPRSDLPCGNIDPVGVTGTPVIDPAAGVLYLDALVGTRKGPRHQIYALSLADGSVLANWPLDVETALRKLGASFSSAPQGERGALLLFANRLYATYGGNYGDCGSYRGTVIQVRTDTPAVEADWQTRANGGGIWAQGGIAGDGTDLFVTTGNTFGASQWSDGEAIIRLQPGLKHSSRTADFFAPSNWKDLDNTDADLGGTEALPLEVAVAGSRPARRVIAFGKDGNAYLADRANLGGIGGALATMPAASGDIRTAPAIYQTDAATMVAFTSPGSSHCPGSNITMLKVAASGASPLSFAWCAPLNGAGAPIVTTTDGKASAIVWAAGAEGDNALHGFNALTGQPVFSGAGTAMSGLRHFATILATRQRFYVAADNAVYAFRWK
jgi:outer membrane protein assembly factor BamB